MYVRLVFYEEAYWFGLSIIKPLDHVVLSSPSHIPFQTSSRFIEWNMHDEVIQFFIIFFFFFTQLSIRKGKAKKIGLIFFFFFTSIDRDVYCQWITNKRQNTKRTKDLREDWKFNLEHFNCNQNRKIWYDYSSLGDWRFFISSSSPIEIGSFLACFDLKYKCHNWITCITINAHKHKITNHA